MPRDFWKCKTCGKKIYYSDGYERRDSLQPKRLISIRRHYKAKHPGKFKRSIARGVAARTDSLPGLRFNKKGRARRWRAVKFVKPTRKKKRRRRKRDLLDLI